MIEKFPKTKLFISTYPILTDDIDTDVIIVGGGVTGCICAYYLAKNNIKSVILE
ncbi:FAD-dependent oxidoreductase, partial [Clostridioides difficile]|uniref:FAD-dependent oxidoreductase n=1 Tax=Clostridioides difficile TaxID=1496 RepID=UPI002FE6CC25